MNSSPPPVATDPAILGTPGTAMPSGALSAEVPNGFCHLILRWARSIAVSRPQGGALQGMPSGESMSTGLAAKGVPRWGGNERLFGAFALARAAWGTSAVVSGWCGVVV